MIDVTSPSEPWCDEGDLPESCNHEAVKPETLAPGFALATTVLFNLTKRRWPGARTDTYRPCCSCDYNSCGCVPYSSIELPGYPVTSISYLKIDGTNAATSDYELRDARYLVPLRRPDSTMLLIPRCQDFTKPTTELNTVEVSYTYGAEPPPEAAMMAAILGYEFALSWTPTTLGACRLPKRVTSITRQGISMALIDPLTLFKEGLVGIPEIDLWIQAVNYGDAHGPAEVWDPMRMPIGTRKN